MKKIVVLFIIGLNLLISGACRVAIPDGDIKDFVDRLTYDYAFQNIDSGKSVIKVTQHTNDEMDGGVTSITYMDKSNDSFYHHISTDVSGIFYGPENGNYLFYHQETLSYLENEESIKTFRITDGNAEDISYDLQGLIDCVHHFFYTSVEGGYHSGGMYFGDYIIANAGKYYSCFSLNEDKTELSYSVNTVQYNSDNEKIGTIHYFKVNQFGMLIESSTKTINIAKNIVLETKINCEYNIKIDKLVSLS